MITKINFIIFCILLSDFAFSQTDLCKGVVNPYNSYDWKHLWTYNSDASLELRYRIVYCNLNNNPPSITIEIQNGDEGWDTTLTEGVLTTNIGYFESRNDSSVSELNFQNGTVEVIKNSENLKSFPMKFRKGYGFPYIKIFTNKIPEFTFLGFFGSEIKQANNKKSNNIIPKTEDSNQISDNDKSNSLETQKNNTNNVGDGEKAVTEAIEAPIKKMGESILETAIKEILGEKLNEFLDKAQRYGENSIKVKNDIDNGEVKESAEFLLSSNKIIKAIQKNSLKKITSAHNSILSLLGNISKTDEESDLNFNASVRNDKELQESNYRSPKRQLQKQAATIFVGAALIIMSAPAWPVIGLAALYQW